MDDISKLIKEAKEKVGEQFISCPRTPEYSVPAYCTLLCNKGKYKCDGVGSVFSSVTGYID